MEISLGFKSTWDFQSVNVNIGLTDHVREEETTDEAVDRIYNYVQTKLMQKIDSTKKEVDEVYVRPGKKSK